MSNSFLRFSTSICMVALFVIGTSCNKNETDVFKNDIRVKSGIKITGSEQVPVVNTAGEGRLDVSYDPATKVLNYNIRWIEMTSGVVAVHFHGPAARGTNGGVIYDINITDYIGSKNGMATGRLTLNNTTLKEIDLLTGFWYVNIHTVNNRNGESRAQVVF